MKLSYTHTHTKHNLTLTNQLFFYHSVSPYTLAAGWRVSPRDPCVEGLVSPKLGY